MTGGEAFSVRGSFGLRVRCLIGAAVAMALLMAATSASANIFTAAGPFQVADSPLAANPACASLVAQQTLKHSTNYADAEVEPYVASDPTNPNHLVGSFQQDRWNDGGSNGLINVVSNDGGVTWTLPPSPPQFSICEGAQPGSAGYLMRATDPWISFSSDGKIVYSISDSFNAQGPAFGGASAIIISRSTSGGNTWQPPVTAIYTASTTALNDKESVTADSLKTNPNTAYAVWDRLVSPTLHANPSAYNHTFAYRGPSFFSKTTDGGQTWSPGRIIFDPGEYDQTIGNQIVEPAAGPAKGVLIDGFDLITNQGGKSRNQRPTYSVAVIRSTDGGASWSSPIVVAPQQVGSVSIAGKSVRSSDELPEFAAGPEGNLYAVWQDSRFTGTSKIAFSMSTDGGLTWSTPIRADQSAGNNPAFVPQVHASSDGTVAINYYELTPTSASPGLTTAEIAHCHSDCDSAANWSGNGETALGGPFDYLTAPDAGGLFLGDYVGLANTGSTGSMFDPFFIMTNPPATKGQTDPFSSPAG